MEKVYKSNNKIKILVSIRGSDKKNKYQSKNLINCKKKKLGTRTT